MAEIAFTSLLGLDHRDQVERLLFFNENQSRSSEAVAYVVERYGMPKLRAEDDRLRVDLASEVSVQTLYAVRPTPGGPSPVGVAVYTRDADALIVRLTAIHEDYSAGGVFARHRVLVQLIAEIKRIARSVRGIERVVVYVGRRTPARLSVRRGA